MQWIAIGLASIAAAFHVLAFVLESVLWMHRSVYRRFGVAGDADAEAMRVMAFNQGFYNLALALVVIIGLVLMPSSGDAELVGKSLICAATGCMAIAGIALAASGRRHLMAATLQFTPAAAACVITWLV
ncbi:MAG: DUF1304 domain-containing protein [Thermoleophilia bacterium]|nr:DUF1304 domain-containing protein [Thermoleophilia bacterium]